MELLRGRPLSQRLQDGPLEPPAALRVCTQVGGAFAAAHASRLVHRDIKPGNVVPRATPRSLTSGSPRRWGSSTPLHVHGCLVPRHIWLLERLAGAPVTAASDVYALGLLLFQALTSQLPWPPETMTEMLAAHVYADPGPPAGPARCTGDGTRSGQTVLGQGAIRPPVGPCRGHRDSRSGDDRATVRPWVRVPASGGPVAAPPRIPPTASRT